MNVPCYNGRMQKRHHSTSEPGTIAQGPFRIEVHQIGPDNKQIRIGAHRHSSPGLLYLERGGGAYYLEERQWETTAGDLYLTAAGTIHNLDRLKEAEGWGILFPVEMLEPAHIEATFQPQPGNSFPSLFAQPARTRISRLQIRHEDRSRWSERCQAMREELHDQKIGYRQIVQAYLTMLLVDTARLVASEIETFRFQEEPLLAEVFSVIEKHYSEPVSLRDVAALVGRSPAYLTTQMRKLTGRTVGEWLIEYRMGKARKLLIETDTPIEIISIGVGYHDPNYFTRLFHRMHGTTPLRWRGINRIRTVSR
jgi:AraC family transcriptional activator of pobA